MAFLTAVSTSGSLTKAWQLPVTVKVIVPVICTCVDKSSVVVVPVAVYVAVVVVVPVVEIVVAFVELLACATATQAVKATRSCATAIAKTG